MCGIAGFWDCSRTAPTETLRGIVDRMTETIRHRGPDDGGAWTDAETGIALGHRRLAIIDLTPAGHQPMESSCGRFVIVFNGEIYNYGELRAELQQLGRNFRGHSDTETLLEGFAVWGIAATITRCIGMFAIAVWDRRERQLTLIRDRLGKKPLYYGRVGNSVLFASELKPFKKYPGFPAEIDRNVIPLLMRHNYIPAPYSIYKNVWKLPPGTLLTLRANDTHPPEPVPFWSFRDVAEAGRRNLFTGSEQDATTELTKLLTDAVRLRMIADVPLGAFLSGGIDSSLITALMQQLSSRPVKTFTIGFEEAGYNEAPYAKAVAKHLGTEHVEHYVTPREALDVIPQLPFMYDEPFADSSQVPTFLVSQLARQHVTVALSGDGGDEIFCGYRRYFDPLRLGRVTGMIPKPLRQLAAWSLTQTASHIRHDWLRKNLMRGARLLNESTPEEIYIRNMQHWLNDPPVVRDAIPAPTEFAASDQWPPFADPRLRWMFIDTRTYLPDDILVKVDRASMAVALESRVPLLDHRVVEFAWTLPQEFKVQGRSGKKILRTILGRHVPTELFERPKTGFGVPIDVWLRGPLRDWAESLLDANRLQQEGWFDPDLVQTRWRQHLNRTHDWHYHLWNVLMFQAWLEV